MGARDEEVLIELGDSWNDDSEWSGPTGEILKQQLTPRMESAAQTIADDLLSELPRGERGNFAEDLVAEAKAWNLESRQDIGSMADEAYANSRASSNVTETRDSNTNPGSSTAYAG